ncbi:acetyltransferase [Thermoclostridium stercorarium subsp. stercorarium DSM 8532]|uniref:Acetyltransferase n=1 Tax=Thermoclostridium stercorarium (strain ATCC 35414 / DSM 8532 / NCIMB 11754) TaxID=1121335 RepID=L7VIN5_THES1|nr:acetyltransferase [Thermoclostridium stercorarium subsp. stercorarium DSM 8532]
MKGKVIFLLTIKRVENSSEFEQAYKIRVEVFVKEQNVPEEIELDEFDKTAVHVVAYRDDEPVGCGRVFMEGDYARIGRVAVLKKERKKGTGRLICEELIRIGKEKGAKKFVLDAQVQAIGFYQKLGFAVKSDVFIEAGIEHVRMEAVFE